MRAEIALLLLSASAMALPLFSHTHVMKHAAKLHMHAAAISDIPSLSTECFAATCSFMDQFLYCSDTASCLSDTDLTCYSAMRDAVCTGSIIDISTLATCTASNTTCGAASAYDSAAGFCASCSSEVALASVTYYNACGITALEEDYKHHNEEDSEEVAQAMNVRHRKGRTTKVLSGVGGEAEDGEDGEDSGDEEEDDDDGNEEEDDEVERMVSLSRNALNSMCTQNPSGYCVDLGTELFGMDLWSTITNGDDERAEYECDCDKLDQCLACDALSTLGCCWTSLSPFLKTKPCSNKHAYKSCSLSTTPCMTGAAMSAYHVGAVISFTDLPYNLTNSTEAAMVQTGISAVINALSYNLTSYLVDEREVLVEDYDEEDDGSRRRRRRLSVRMATTVATTTMTTSVIVYNKKSYADTISGIIGQSSFATNLASTTGATSVTATVTGVSSYSPSSTTSPAFTVSVPLVLTAATALATIIVVM